MTRFLVLIILLLLYFSGTAQVCKCPPGSFYSDTEKPRTIFTISNEKIGLCGGTDIVDGDTVYSEFSIYLCGRNEKIDEWGALEPCKVKHQKNSLLVEELVSLPTGPDFAEIRQPFYINEYYFEKGILKKTTYYNKKLRKFKPTKIKAVFDDYSKLVRENSERQIDIANRLFWCYVSGSKQAGLYLDGFLEKFGPFDGAIAEEWNEIFGTYQLWKEKNNR